MPVSLNRKKTSSAKPPASLGRNLLTLVLTFLLLLGVMEILNTTRTKPVQEVDISKIAQEVRDNKIQRLEVVEDQVKAKHSDGSWLTARRELTQPLSQLLRDYGVTPEQLSAVEIAVQQPSGFQTWLNALLPFILPFILVGLLVWMLVRQMQGASNRALGFGQTTARAMMPDSDAPKTTFKNVAGAVEAKEELQEVVMFLRDPQRFRNLGAKVPKGVLLMGAPGTGKTLMAKAVAGEAGVPFFHLSGSEFVEMFVGVGASRVRDLFRRAKKFAPCIIFIDEIDAVGRQRGAGLGGSHDEREQTLNQILVEMDGFETDANVIVIAASNRPDVLDPALLRPGRFDRQVTIDLPDVKERQEILIVHAQGKPLEKSVNLETVAKHTPGFSGADLANILNEAAILAARRKQTTVTQEEIDEATEKVKLGPQRRSFLLNEKEKRTVAYHEAGHALVAHLLPQADPVHKVSIISRGRAAGYTTQLPEERRLQSRSHLEANLAVLLSGYEAELLVNNEVTTGGGNDLQRATELARDLVMRFGMNQDLGPRTFGEQNEMVFLGREIHAARDYSEKTAELIDKEVTNLIIKAQKSARQLLTAHKTTLDKIVATLLDKETIEADTFLALVEGGK